MQGDFATIIIDRELLELLYRLLGRAQEAGLVQEEEQEDFGFLRTLIRDFVLDFETRPLRDEEAAAREDADLDEEANRRDAHSARMEEAFWGRGEEEMD